MTFRQVICIGLLLFGLRANSQDSQIIGDKYTFEAMDKKIEGKVYVTFVMAPNGRILDDSVKAHKQFYGLEIVAEKAIKDAPDYKYTQGAKPSNKNQKFVIPISFKLDALNDKDWSEYYTIKGKKALDSTNLDEAKKHLTGRNSLTSLPKLK